MAKIGLKYPVYKSDTTQGVIGKAIQADIAITSNDVPLYADDAIAESDKSFQTGTITLGIDDLRDVIQTELLGHAVNGGSEVVANVGDIAPYVGVGFYGTKRVNNVNKFRAIWLTKVQFAEPADTNATRAATVAFSTPVIIGTIMVDDNGDWKKEETFDTEADAIAYLNDKAGIPVEASGGLTGLTMTGTGGTLSPSFGAAVRYYTYGGVTGTSVTVTPTAAGHAIKLYVDDVLAQTLSSGVASSAISIPTAGTKKLTIVAQEAGKQSQTTEIIVVKTA